MNHPRVVSFKMTCGACPEAYEGFLDDGKWFYFRYRHGSASVSVGPPEEDYGWASLRAKQHYGDPLDGRWQTEEERDTVFSDLLSELGY